MKRGVWVLLLSVFFLWNFPTFSQYEKPGVSAPGNPEEIVQEWFDKLNALDGTDEAVNGMVALYQPDALQQAGPSENQFGPVFYQSHRQIKKWAQDFSKTHAPIPETTYYTVRPQTVNEKTALLFHSVQAPWGDSAVSVEFTGRYINPGNGKGFMVSGAAFFQIREGKIWRLRLYMPREEIMEITPPLKS